MLKDELLYLHGRLIGGDLVVASKIVELTLARLVAIVGRDVPELDDQQDAEQACLDSLLDYLEDPAAYEPERSQLVTYLAMKARFKAMTIARSQRRRRHWEDEYAQHCAEQQAICAAEMSRDCEDRLLLGIEGDRLHERFGAELLKDHDDLEVFSLMASGEAFGTEYVLALGLPTNEAGIAEARRRYERIRSRIRRIGERMRA